MKKVLFISFIFTIFLFRVSIAQTIPNSGFENWIDHGQYDDPQYWDTPNEEVCSILTGFTQVVTKSTDHQSGSFSAKLETKTIPFFGIVVPGVVTLGTLTIDILGGTYEITGGVPITNPVTHLKGFYKFLPKGGDSCAIGIGLTQWVNGMQDSVGIGYFSTHDTVTVWTPFSAWINIDSLSVPDSMNIIAISSAMDAPTEGTVLFIDDLYLDYTVGVKDERPSAGIEIHQDREFSELQIFFDFPSAQSTSLRLYNMMGERVLEIPQAMRTKERIAFGYNQYKNGIYILEIVHDNQSYCRKFMFNR